MASPVARLIVVGLAVFLHTPAQAAIDWSGVSDLSDSDKADITQLAVDLGLSDATSASPLTIHPGGGKAVVIGTTVLVNERRRVWREIQVCRMGEGYCSELSKESVGDWGAIGEIERQERWRFSDGDWFVDVELGSAISYAEAESIILAIHRNLLTYTPELNDSKRVFDASNIRSIHTIDPIAREFGINIDTGGSGYFLEVRLEGSEVELYSLAMWRA